MSRISTKDNCTIYQLKRENLGWSRAKAAEETYISESRIEKIESEKTKANPEDVVAMADSYKSPELCNHYCVHECAIGQKLNFGEIENKNLAQIVLEILTTLNQLDQEKNRLIEIAADEHVSDDELADFVKIQTQLNNISQTVDSLKLWVMNTISSGNLNEDKLEELSNK